jgi:hypothetical protein
LKAYLTIAIPGKVDVPTRQKVRFEGVIAGKVAGGEENRRRYEEK